MTYCNQMSVPKINITLKRGSVWLAGAGPGDPGLLTLHAVNGLHQADIIVYDALVSKEILKLANPSAALEFAGKRGGKPSPKQVDISLRLIHLARKNKRVLRLKGGDPFVFGRGGRARIGRGPQPSELVTEGQPEGQREGQSRAAPP